MKNYVVRGIILGGSVGALASLAGILPNLPRAVAIGMVGGFLAGITLAKRHNK